MTKGGYWKQTGRVKMWVVWDGSFPATSKSAKPIYRWVWAD